MDHLNIVYGDLYDEKKFQKAILYDSNITKH